MNKQIFIAGLLLSVGLHAIFLWPVITNRTVPVVPKKSDSVSVRELEAEKVVTPIAERARKLEVKTEPEPQAKSEPKPEAKPESKPEVTTDPKPEVKPASQPEPAPKPAPEPQPAMEPEVVLESAPAPEMPAVSKVVAEPEPAPIPTPEPAPIPTPEPAPTPTPEPAPTPTPERQAPPPSLASQPAQLFRPAVSVQPAIESVPIAERVVEPVLPERKPTQPLAPAPRSAVRIDHPPAVETVTTQTPVSQSGPALVKEPASRFVIPSLSSKHRTTRSLHPIAPAPLAMRSNPPQQLPQRSQIQVQPETQVQPVQQFAAPSTQDVGTNDSVGLTAPPNSAAQRSTSGVLADRGVLRQGSFEPPQDPVARIAWGEASQALRTMDMGRMVLVIVDAELKIVGGIDGTGGNWQRTSIPSDLSTYSNRVRVVDHIPGFSIPRSVCESTEHLAVIIPVGLERRIEKAMDTAAKRAGLQRQQVAACYGTLISNRAGLEFAIDRVERRNKL